MSKFLIEDTPQILLPKLAIAVGDRGALFLQNLHYLLLNKMKEIKVKENDPYYQKILIERHVRYGRVWIYNTYESWIQNYFPYWSVSTLRRIINFQSKKEIIIKNSFDQPKGDSVLWYTIKYEICMQVLMELFKMNTPPVQNEHTPCSKWTSLYNDPKNTTKNTTKNGSIVNQLNFLEPHNLDFKDEKAGSNGKGLFHVEKSKEWEPEAFLEFYKAYPKKPSGEEPAKKKWNELKPNPEQIMYALSMWKSSKQWQNKQFIPSPESWLHKKRFKADFSTIEMISNQSSQEINSSMGKIGKKQMSNFKSASNILDKINKAKEGKSEN